MTFPPSQLQGYYATLRFCIVITIDLYGFLGPATADQLAEQACLCQFAESLFLLIWLLLTLRNFHFEL